MKTYDELKPGVYLQYGDNLKSVGREYLGSFAAFLKDVQEGGRSVEQLAEAVGWVFVALNKRKMKILEIPYHWERNGDEIEYAQMPIKLKSRQLWQQTDESLQLYSQAYYLKQRVGRRLVGLRWLDPVTIEPDYDTATPENGVTRYWYTKDNGPFAKTLPAEDVIAVTLPGLRELQPGTSAGVATRLAAAIVRGIGETSATFFGNNALPITLVIVPESAGQAEISRLEAFWKRITNQGRGSNEMRATATRGDVKIETLSLAPKDLAQRELEDAQVDLILAAHDVPRSVVLSDAANYATDLAAARRFTAAMGSRLEYIASVINEDADIMAMGLEMVVNVEHHADMKEDEAQRAEAFVQFVAGGLTPQAAAYLVGVTEEDFPEDFGPIFEEKPEPQPVPPQFQQQQPEPMPDENDDEERRNEIKAFRNWLKKRDNPNLENFKAYHMTDEEKEFIYWQVTGGGAVKAVPDDSDIFNDMLDQFSKAMRQFDESMRGSSGVGDDGGSDDSDEIAGWLSQEFAPTDAAILE